MSERNERMALGLLWLIAGDVGDKPRWLAALLSLIGAGYMLASWFAEGKRI